MSNSSETTRTRVPSRQVAWGLLTTNLGLPGLGSLLAGRKIGVPQLLLSLTALILTMGFGLKFVLWYFANQDMLRDPYADPLITLKAMWLAVRWALLGIVLFVVAVLWGLVTSWSILRSAPRPPPSPSRENSNP